MTGANIILSGSIGTAAGSSILGSSLVSFTSDADHTLSANEATAQFLAVTSSVSLTTTRNLIAPLDAGRFYTVKNSTTGGHSIQIIGSSGTGVTVSNGSTLLVETDGTNYFTPAGITQLTGDGTAGPGTGSQVLTLGTVNANVGTFGDSTHVSQVTVNAKGLITAISSVTITGAAPTGAAGGDLSGTYPNPAVAKINAASVPAAGALTTGNVLQVSGTSALTYGAINLAGGNNFVTGLLPVTNVSHGTSAQVLMSNATPVTTWTTISGDMTLGATGTSTLATVNANVGSFGSSTSIPVITVNAKGLITAVSTVTPVVSVISGITVSGTPTAGQVLTATSGTAADWQTPSGSGVTWASDLSGSTNTNQYVGSISGAAGFGGNVTINVNTLQFATTQTTPALIQSSTSTASGAPLLIEAQSATGASHNGGNLVLSSGSSGSATVGAIDFQLGGTAQMSLTTGNLSFDVAVANCYIGQDAVSRTSPGATLALQAQSNSGTGGGAFGGELVLASGTGGASSSPGVIYMYVGAQQQIVAANGYVGLGNPVAGVQPYEYIWSNATSDTSEVPFSIFSWPLPSSGHMLSFEVTYIARDTVTSSASGGGRIGGVFTSAGQLGTTYTIWGGAGSCVLTFGVSGSTINFNVVDNGDVTQWSLNIFLYQSQA